MTTKHGTSSNAGESAPLTLPALEATALSLRSRDEGCALCGAAICFHGRYIVRAIDGKWYWHCLDCEGTGEGPQPWVYSLPMYEGQVVTEDAPEWAGFAVCPACYKKHTKEAV